MTLAKTRCSAELARGRVDVDVLIRPGTSDMATVQQVFGSLDYDLRRLRRYAEIEEHYDRAAAAGRTPLVLDLGANIGAAALYFAHAWPASHVLAVEPAADNFRLLFENIQEHDNITAWHAGAASVPGRLRIADPGAEKWAYRTAPAADADRDGVAAVSVDAMLAEFSAGAGYDPFIVKIDIEGAEAELFSANTGWIERFPVLIIELHDWMLCGEASSASFLRAIAPLGRDFVHIGENVFSIANRR